ncbi:MAG: hypothetical protein BGO01_08415 [Armatimonadetes bacterium 55-13]|nr:hypothetical protein [Armatimonadota bacterium]OJU62491.1 MAG: hypothetical protein BGO01_08415 [Armatimonadetes bacterium 55-13]
MITAIATLFLAQPVLELQIKAQKATYRANQDIYIDVAAKNVSKKTFEVVPALDGCDTGRRGPSGRFYVRSGKKNWEPLSYKIGRCGNTNPLEAQNFLPVLPGQRAMLVQGPSWYPSSRFSQLGAPGQYEVKFIYDTTLPFESWIGGPLPADRMTQRMIDLQSHFASVPKGEFESNVIRITVLPEE